MQPALPEAYQLFHDGVLALSRVEDNGIRIDEEYLSRVDGDIDAQIRIGMTDLESDTTYKQWKDIYGESTNLDSPEQLRHILFTTLGYESKKTTKTGLASTDKAVLQEIDLPFLRKYADIRTLKKARGTFLKGIRREVVDGYLHPTFNLHTAATYRSSSGSDKSLGDFGGSINFQNLPVRNPLMAGIVRSCFVPRPGYQLLEMDLSGIEVRIAYCYHKDPVMGEYLHNPKSDMHRDMAAECYLIPIEKVSDQSRYCAKNKFVFPQFYGSVYFQCAPHLWEALGQMQLRIKMPGDDGKKATGPLLQEHLASLGITELGRCDPRGRPIPGTYEHHIRRVESDFWDNRFSVYKRWKQKWWEAYLENKGFYNYTGFYMRWGKGGLLSRNDAVNYPVQSAGFHCLLQVLIWTEKWLRKNKMRSRIVGQIHDSLILDCHPDEVQDVIHQIHYYVTRALPRAWKWIIVPLEIEAELCEVDQSWHHKKKVKLAV